MIKIPGILRPLTRQVRSIVRRLGYDIVVAQTSKVDVRMHWLRKLNVDVILDVGANEGQFVGWMRDRGFEGSIVSFEPQEKAFGILQKHWGHTGGWSGYRTALGDHDGTIAFQIAGNSVSSSVLPMLNTHVNALPESAIISTDNVTIKRIDQIRDPLIQDAKSFYIKIDTQGYELPVLNGATGILDRASVLEIELSLVPLYDGQPLAHEVIKKVVAMGFTPIWIEQGFSTPKGDQMLQVDGLFIATHLLNSASLEPM
jgi:FkbM family methyltransferase